MAEDWAASHTLGRLESAACEADSQRVKDASSAFSTAGRDRAP